MSFADDHPREHQLMEAIKAKRFEDAQSILADGADPRITDENGLTSVDYAQLSGNLEFFTHISRVTREINVKTVTQRFPDLCQTFLSLPDFKVTFDWAVKSWVPFVSMFCPFDRWILTKVGSRLRIDTTLANWSGFRWTRGSVSVFFDAACTDMMDSFLAIDNVSGDRISVLREMIESEDIDRDIQILMQLDLIKGFIQINEIIKEQSKGWFGRKAKIVNHDQTFMATPFDIKNAKIKFLHYYCNEFGKENPKVRLREKTYSAKFWCSNDFPVQPRMLTPFLEALAPFKDTARNVLSLFGMFDGDGMPVRGEVFVFPTVKLEFKFIDYNGDVASYRNDVIPPGPTDVAMSPEEIEQFADAVVNSR